MSNFDIGGRSAATSTAFQSTVAIGSNLLDPENDWIPKAQAYLSLILLRPTSFSTLSRSGRGTEAPSHIQP